MINYLAAFVNTNGVGFPGTLGVNATAPGAGDGTEFVKLFIDDIWGRAQALLDYAGMTPDGVTEAPGTAQILQAISRGYNVGPGVGVLYLKNGTPAANGDRCLLLQGQTILIATYPLLAAACYVGNANNATAPAFYKTSDTPGTVRDTAGAYMVLPDARACGIKMPGTQSIGGRTKTGPAFCVVEEDRMQGHRHDKILTFTNNTYCIPFSGGGYSLASGINVNIDYLSNHISLSLDVTDPITDGVNGTPRTGASTRDTTIGIPIAVGY